MSRRSTFSLGFLVALSPALLCVATAVCLPVWVGINNENKVSSAVAMGDSFAGKCVVIVIGDNPTIRQAYLEWCDVWHAKAYVEVMLDMQSPEARRGRAYHP